MKRALVFVAVLLTIAASPRCGGTSAGAEARHSRCNDLNGNKLWESTVTIVPVAGKPPGHFILKEEGKGSYSDFKGFTSNKSEFEFINDDRRLEPVYLKRQVFSGDGKVIFEETQRFDDKGRVECEVKDLFKKENRKKVFNYKGDIVNQFMMGSYIRRFLRAGEKEKTTYLVNDEPALYRVTLKVVGKEEITVNGKKREAYKICIDPQIGLLSPVKAFLPKNYDWHSTQPPYEWLMFRGLESSINSPKVEIISLDD